MQSEPLICGSSPRFPLSVSSLTAPHSQLSADAQPAQSPTVLAPPQTPAPASATSSTADLSCDLSSRSSKKKQTPISYAADRIIGSGSFGVVYEAKVLETGESVAIKKVRQDRRFKNRELEVMSKLGSLHPNVIALRHCFYSRDNQNQKNPDDLYLNLVMSYIPSTLYRSLRDHTKASRLVPMFYTRLYVWQMCRAVHYIHSMEICHRDIKPQNLLLFPPSAAATSTMFSPHQLLLCDFGSAKVLVPGEPNVSYICSRFYRAPELVFEATQYSASIDMWSVGAVFGELLLGSPLFPGESSVDQLIEIIKVLGTPTRDEIIAMNKLNSVAFKFPVIQPAPLTKVFKGKAPDDAMDLITHFLKYDPKLRIHPLDALAHPFFDPLRVENAGSAANAGTTKDVSMPPKLFQFTEEEITTLKNRGIYDRVVPPQYRHYPPLQPLAVRIGGSQQSASAPTPSSSSAAAQHASPASHLTSTSLNPVAVASA